MFSVIKTTNHQLMNTNAVIGIIADASGDIVLLTDEQYWFPNLQNKG